MADDTRGGWLAAALARRTRHPALEQTLFHRLREIESGPLEQLGELVRALVGELAITRERVAGQARDLRALEQSVASLKGRLDALTAPDPVIPKPAEGHLLLLSSAAGYRLVERPGPPPAPGDPVEHEGRLYRILGHGASPLPADRRPSLLALPD